MLVHMPSIWIVTIRSIETIHLNFIINAIFIAKLDVAISPFGKNDEAHIVSKCFKGFELGIHADYIITVKGTLSTNGYKTFGLIKNFSSIHAIWGKSFKLGEDINYYHFKV